MTDCLHCGTPVESSEDAARDGFCCTGCAAAHALIRGQGLERYYRQRSLDRNLRALKPEEDPTVYDLGAHLFTEDEGRVQGLHLMVEGLHCAACVWLIESLLTRHPGVEQARVNMTTRRLVLKWRTGEVEPQALLQEITSLGYRLVPFDSAWMDRESKAQEKALLRALAVAGFAAGNIMLLSVAVWSGAGEMGAATRDFLHGVSALIALPTIAYAGQPFYRSAWRALARRSVNMDVPISLAVLLAALMSLYETFTGGEHAYFDSAVTLLFFLLIGRYLDRRARGKARSAAEQLLAMNAVSVTVLEADGTRRMVPPAQVDEGMRVLVAAGERIGVDGRVVSGTSDVDGQLITGESLPESVTVGAAVFAGTLNLTNPLVLEVSATGEQTLLAEIVRLMETAEQGRGEYVAIADRVASYYAPVVHALGLIAFLGWWLLGGLLWQDALLIAVSVLIITCPCALALAVPVVQVVASGRLLRGGIMVKTATALERLSRATKVVFDKTGTLTLGRPEWVNRQEVDDSDLRQAAALAANSRHPLSRTLMRAAPHVAAAEGVEERPGEGLRLATAAGDIRLGRAAFVGATPEVTTKGPELWLAQPGKAAVRFEFRDAPRRDAAEVVGALSARGLTVSLLSGDRASVVEDLATRLGIDDWRAEQSPKDKVSALQAMSDAGERVCMVGDGINDAPALAAAAVSMSPTTAADVSRTAADMVFQGEDLSPVVEALDVARRAETLVKQNFALAFLYNAVTIPLAMAGYVTPLVAAIAMSTSSVVVIANALRLSGGRRRL